MQNTLEEAKQVLFAKVNEVYDVFKSFFGEEHVDLQSPFSNAWLSRMLPKTEDGKYNVTDSYKEIFRRDYTPLFILVWWPEVTVKNEYDKSIVIQDLYAKVNVNVFGEIPSDNTFYLNRARYSRIQWESDYLHSHIQHIPNPIDQFLTPCLGRGPIIQTINQLHVDASDINWMLFCQELSMFVTVESLAGGPWKALEKVGKHNSTRTTWIDTFNHIPVSKVAYYGVHHYADLLKEFIPYYLRKASLNIGFNGDIYDLGMSFFDYNVDISNAFIEFYNSNPEIRERFPKQELFEDKVLLQAVASDKRFGVPQSELTRGRRDSQIGNHVCYFKGRDITLVVDGSIEEIENLTTILSPHLTKNLKNNILNSINYRYGREESDSEDTATTNKKVLYI